MTQDELDLVPFDDLVRAMARRAEAAALVWMVSGDEGTPDLCYTRARWFGNTHTCLGLIIDLQESIKARMARDAEAAIDEGDP